MDKNLIKKILKYAEECDNMAQYKNADILIKHIIMAQAPSRRNPGGANNYGGGAWGGVSRAIDVVMGRSSLIEQLALSINGFVERRDNAGSIEDVSNALSGVIDTANNAIIAARDQALTGKRGANGTAEGMGLSPGARGSNEGAAAGKDQTAREQQLTSLKWFDAMDKTVTGAEALNRGLRTAWDRIGDLENGMRTNLRSHMPRQIFTIQ